MKPRPTGSWPAERFGTRSDGTSRGRTAAYYSSMEVAYRWIVDAGEEVVYLIPDGITDVTKSERTGCYPDVFARVLAYKEAHVEKTPSCRVGIPPERRPSNRRPLRGNRRAP